ncbi:hypothetical protein GN156_26915 [bacterium LRH843]|nr:hypothetical protein [bacterium LRH843]
MGRPNASWLAQCAAGPKGTEQPAEAFCGKRVLLSGVDEMSGSATGN